jgi:hypothetical protein
MLVNYNAIYTSSSVGSTTLVGLSACSTVVEHSQQEGFTEYRCQQHVKPPTWRRTMDLERSNFPHKRPPASEATLANPAAEDGTMGEKWPRNFAESGDFHVTLGLQCKIYINENVTVLNILFVFTKFQYFNFVCVQHLTKTFLLLLLCDYRCHHCNAQMTIRD